jgi:UDP-N-acetylglucosamine 4,6-dehydratase/5-epimerase
MFENQKLLITGGTGSFGNAVLLRVLDSKVSEVRIFSRDEKKQDDMRNRHRDPRLSFVIGDVRDRDALEDAAAGVDYIFHSAALKQVPSCEFYPMEAVRTNVMGTENTLLAAEKCGVKRVVVLSTDKAAYPINAMGISKAMMEKVAVARSRVAAHRGCVVSCTRYGNVMASRGSVIPLFLKQIQSGQPLTVTDPEMTRFMMSLEEAVDLVLYAFEHARPGDLFVQKSPAATIGTLAEALQRLLGVNLEVRVIGTRHGEKLYETLLTREEQVRAEDLGDYYRVQADSRDLNYNLYFTEGSSEVGLQDDYHSHNTRRMDVTEMMDRLRELPIVQRAIRGERVED